MPPSQAHARSAVLSPQQSEQSAIAEAVDPSHLPVLPLAEGYEANAAVHKESQDQFEDLISDLMSL